MHHVFDHDHASYFFLGATTVISEGLRNVLDGMRKHGIKQITVVGVG